MPSTLRAQPFSPALLGDVQDFCSGHEPWQTEVDQWIKDDPAAADRVSSYFDKDLDIWLYRNEDKEVVGFGSLGISEWKWPPPDGPRTEIAIIPYVAVQQRFQGKPDGIAKEERYAGQIIGHLIDEARERGYDTLGLHVNRDNYRAISFYERWGFQRLSDNPKRPNFRMHLDLATLPNDETI